jgi:predicted GNAT superfamily acetyltransferase
MRVLDLDFYDPSMFVFFRTDIKNGFYVKRTAVAGHLPTSGAFL